ncbi:MAG: hypothetical protein PG981_000552 [Wolbachia endosymbiont of Ctenocephalides orientis wCori]|nr:MAG: hypothetical protein PG981_000552 [Wolbachia endosymbiont of Ctenocephalides orientis wCori]
MDVGSKGAGIKLFALREASDSLQLKIDFFRNSISNGNLVVEAELRSSNTFEYSAVLACTPPKNFLP